MIISPGTFFSFSKFWFAEMLGVGVGGLVKRWKMVQNDKKLYLSHSVSQEMYIIWLWFLVHMCKIMISPAVFFHDF